MRILKRASFIPKHPPIAINPLLPDSVLYRTLLHLHLDRSRFQSWHSAMVVQTRRKAKAKGKSRPPHRGDQALDDKATRVNKQKIQKEQVTSTSLTTSISQDSRRDTIRSTMFELISHTQVSSTICPSQVPRTLHDRSPRTYPDWRAMMDEVRDEVWEQVRAGTVQVTQRGDVRDYEGRFDIKGPIRVKRGPNWDAR